MSKRMYPRTDAGNAEMFAALFKDKLRYLHSRKQWFVWRGHWWVQDGIGEVQGMAIRSVRSRMEIAARIPDTDEFKKQVRWALESEARPRLDAILKLSQAMKPLADAGTQWDSDPWSLGVANGVVDLSTGQLRDGHPTERISLHTHVPFDPSARCPRWEKFLREVFGEDGELIDFIHRAVGYSLSGETSEQCIFICHGTGANGKSTLLEVFRYVLGDYAHNTPFSTLELKARTSIPNDVAALTGRRFVTALEVNESVRMNEARIKALTGCDPITARFLHREFFTFRPVAKFWLAVNHKPHVVDDSSGFWRRIRLNPFLREFTKETADKQLLSKLQAEASGILSWAVRGCLKWQREGLEMPTVVQDATRAYREESDLVREFISDCCVVHPKAKSSVGTLWQHFQDWIEANGDRCPLARRAFNGRMESKGFQRSRIGHDRTRMWEGICRKIDGQAQGIVVDADTRADADAKSSLSPIYPRAI